MIALVIGLGSMGKRRIRLLRQMNGEIRILGVDTKADRREEALVAGCNAVYSTLEEGLAERPGMAFVCTAPLSHFAIIRSLLMAKVHVFSELNLVSDGYEELEALAKENHCVLFLSSTMLYRRETRYIAQQVHKHNRPVSYNYHIGQYLPDWHPWESYQQFFVNERRTNGCREIMAIELPWLIQAFGKIQSMHVVKDRISSLQIDYSDRFTIMLEHENRNIGTLMIDILCPLAVRNLEVFSEGLQLFWEGKPTSLFEFDGITGQKKQLDLYTSFEQRGGYAATIIEDAYADEIRAFLAEIQGEMRPLYSFSDDADVLRVIDQIEGVCK